MFDRDDFNLSWNALVQAGQADELGSVEYQRVRSAWDGQLKGLELLAWMRVQIPCPGIAKEVTLCLGKNQRCAILCATCNYPIFDCICGAEKEQEVDRLLNALPPKLKSYIVEKGKLCYLDSSAPGMTLLDFEQDIMNAWREEDGPCTILIQDEEGVTVATMMRCGQPHNCTIIEANGGYGMYRVNYELDEQERYQRTVIEQLLW